MVATDVYGNMYAAIHSGQFSGTRTLQAGLVYLGSGWYIDDLVYVYDFDGDGRDDITAKRNSGSTLLAYQRTTAWTVSPDNTAFGTYRSPVAVGYNWFVSRQ